MGSTAYPPIHPPFFIGPRSSRGHGNTTASRCRPGRWRRCTGSIAMTRAWSRRQYVECVWDRTVPTWLGCHRQAVEWFAAVPQRLVIDSPKCAITRACIHNPPVQRDCAECTRPLATMRTLASLHLTVALWQDRKSRWDGNRSVVVVRTQDARREPCLVGDVADQEHGTRTRVGRRCRQDIVDPEVAVGCEWNAG